MLLTRPLRRLAQVVPAAVLACAAAACTDRANPLAPAPDSRGSPVAPITIQMLECTASRVAGTVSCVPARQEGGARGNILVGSQAYIQLTSSNVAYNAGTGQYTFDVTVKNLIEQPIGTTDGTTLDPGGIRVFFQSGPTVTSGSGTVGVVPDGFATFTAASQAYYQYNGVLAQTAVSPARSWMLVMPPTVLTFSFTLVVSAPVQYPNGYITLDGHLPGASHGNLPPGGTHSLTAVVKSVLGTAAAAGTVTYATSDPACATVDAAGVVTAVAAGTCTITATSGVRSGSLAFTVTGTTRTWTGAVSTNWSTGGNWVGGVVPAAADSVVIPAGVPNFPVLTSNVGVADVTVADLATLSLGAFDLTSSGNVATGPTAGSGIVASTGTVILTGLARTMHGRFPATSVSGTYTVNGLYWGQIPQTVAAGRISVSGFEMTIAQ